MNYEHIALFPENHWLSLAMGIAALLLFYVASRYVYPKREITTKNESKF